MEKELDWASYERMISVGPGIGENTLQKQLFEKRLRDRKTDRNNVLGAQAAGNRTLGAEISRQENLVNQASPIKMPNETSIYGSSTSTIQAQTTVYARLQADIALAQIIRKTLTWFSKEGDVNKAFPWLKNFRKQLAYIKQRNCQSNFVQVNNGITALVKAFNRRMAQKGGSAPVKAAADRLINYINFELENVDCIEKLYEDTAKFLTGGAPIGELFAAIEAFGRLFAALQGVLALNDFLKTLDPDAYLLKQMQNELDCMLKSCDNATVSTLVRQMADDLNLKIKKSVIPQSATKGWSLEANFASKYKGGSKFMKSIQRFMDALKNLSC